MPPIQKIVGAGSCSVVLDVRSLPIVFATWTGVPDLELIDAYFDAQTAISTELRERGQQIVIVTDGRAMGRTSAIGRQRIADRSDAGRDLYGATILASCTVITSALVRGVITALGWLDPGMRVPSFPTLEDAVAWAKVELGKAGIEPPPIDFDEVTLAAARA